MGKSNRPREERLLGILGTITALIVALTGFLNAIPPFFGALSGSRALMLLAVVTGLGLGAFYLLRAAPALSWHNRRLVSGLILLGCLALVIASTTQFARHSRFYEHFDDTAAQGFLSRGWTREEPNEELWSRPSADGALTLYTGRGDNWTMSKEICPIQNLVSRPAPTGDFEAIVKIGHFGPEANWQQAGLIIHGDDGRYARFTYSFDSAETPPRKLQAVTSKGLKRPEGVFNGPPLNVDWGSGERLWLRIAHEGDDFVFSHKTIEWQSWETDAALRLQMRPDRISIAAFQGCSEHPTPTTSKPITADPVPVDFDSFELSWVSRPIALPPWGAGAVAGLAAALITLLLERVLRRPTAERRRAR